MNQIKAEEWLLANSRMIAKVIAEMSFEQLVHPGIDGTGYLLSLQSGVQYRFTAWLTIWGFLRIDVASVERRATPQDEWTTADSAGQYFIDVQAETGMDDIILGNFLEEMQRTLYADMRLYQLQLSYQAAEMIRLDGDTLQGLLDGHPKALVNKGRIGWGASDIERFAPESMPAMQLFWLAVDRSRVEHSQHNAWSWSDLIAESMQGEEIERFQQATQDINPDYFVFMPVHPWQWDQIIQQQFAGPIALRQIIPLGFFGDRYRPQTSLRTMSNLDRPERLQIKLAISILNTSCVRGLPAQYVAIAPQLSQWLAQICANDPLLLAADTQVLKDVASAHQQHEIYGKVKTAPYRYHEYLGAVWRESSQANLRDGEQTVITASLFQKDHVGKALIAQWIQLSGMSIAEWLKAYFQVIVIPLFHLQCKYGIGIVAHGQNIVLRLSHGRPVGMLLKDLQGDMRIVDEDLPELESLEPAIRAKLMKLPAHYLIHDLQTGHLITVLRFISATLQEAMGFAEAQFYQILSQELQNYQASQPELADRFPKRSLLEPNMVRVLVNKVRFKIGYADNAERPLPTLGTDLVNPLYFGSQGANNVGATI